MINVENQKLGAIKAILSEHMASDEVINEMERYPTMTIIGLGQGGGRIATEFSRFGLPTYLVNSSKSDMEEHDYLIPKDHRILTSSDLYPELEGTDKNAQLGFEIAKENKDMYKKLALSKDVQEADFVWVCVSLGGGTGNGALKIALAYLSKVRENRVLPNGHIPLGVICSLPSKDEKGTSFRKNALAGINVLQNMVNENKIGSVLVIDNEKMNDYYANNPLKTYAGTEIDAKSYSNMVVAALVNEVASLPLLQGRSVFDKTEFLSTISTPGWLSLSKAKDIQLDDNLEININDLYTKNEILAENSTYDFISGAIAVLYPKSKNISPKIADDVYRYASNLLNTKVNLSISTNSKINGITLYGLAVVSTPPSRIAELKNELDSWIKIEKEQERKKQEASKQLGLDQFDDFFSDSKLEKRKRNMMNFDDLEDEENQIVSSTTKKPPISMDDLDDIDF